LRESDGLDLSTGGRLSQNGRREEGRTKREEINLPHEKVRIEKRDLEDAGRRNEVGSFTP